MKKFIESAASESQLPLLLLLSAANHSYTPLSDVPAESRFSFENRMKVTSAMLARVEKEIEEAADTSENLGLYDMVERRLVFDWILIDSFREIPYRNAGLLRKKFVSLITGSPDINDPVGIIENEIDEIFQVTEKCERLPRRYGLVHVAYAQWIKFRLESFNYLLAVLIRLFQASFRPQDTHKLFQVMENFFAKATLLLHYCQQLYFECRRIVVKAGDSARVTMDMLPQLLSSGLASAIRLHFVPNESFLKVGWVTIDQVLELSFNHALSKFDNVQSSGMICLYPLEFYQMSAQLPRDVLMLKASLFNNQLIEAPNLQSTNAAFDLSLINSSVSSWLVGFDNYHVWSTIKNVKKVLQLPLLEAQSTVIKYQSTKICNFNQDMQSPYMSQMAVLRAIVETNFDEKNEQDGVILRSFMIQIEEHLISLDYASRFGTIFVQLSHSLIV
jgi:hypothetical protein